MKIKKLSIATLSIMLMASGLTACGGSDSSSSSTGNATNPPVNTSLSEIEQAKEIVRTAKLFLTDADSVQKTYESASDLMTDKQQDRLSDAVDIPAIIHDYMRKHNLTTLTAAQLQDLTKRDTTSFENLYSYLGQISLVPSSDFQISRTADDQFTMQGKLTATKDIYDYVRVNNRYTYQQVDKDIYEVVYKGYKDTLDRIQNSSTIQGNFGFDSITIGSGAELVNLTANQTAGQFNASFSKNVNYNSEFDIDTVHMAGTTLNKGEATIKNIVLTANGNTVNATELSASALDISNIVDGQTLIRTVPYQFKIAGQLKMATPKTDATFSLNASAKESDIKNMLVIDANDEVVEKNGVTLPITALVSIKGQATGENNKTIPLDFQATLNRKANKIVSLDDLVASVEGKTLYALGTSNFDANNELLNSEVTFKQNKAMITVKFDKNNDAINTNGKIADILVNGKDYGDLMQNGSMITAKFIDESLITL